MTNRLTKTEWENIVIKYHTDVLGKQIPDVEIKILWHNYTRESLRLDICGFKRFKEAQIEFHKYDCIISAWTGLVYLGLARIPCPYYLEIKKDSPYQYDFYISDPELAMMLMFMDNDLVQFVKGFL